MEREDVRALIATALKLPSVGDDASLGKLRGWDSLSQVTLMMALEQRLGVTVPPDLFAELTSVDAIMDFVRSA